MRTKYGKKNASGAKSISARNRQRPASGGFTIGCRVSGAEQVGEAMDARAPLPPIGKQKPSWDKAAALTRQWELNKLAERLEKLAG